jgi:tubulin alpha
MNGEFKSLYNPSNMIMGKEDAANNYARGHYTISREYIEPVMEQIQKLAENCEGMQGFLIYNRLVTAIVLFIANLMRNCFI